MLTIILSSVRYLARQGLALRGGGDDAESNLIQLLQLRAEDNPNITQWLRISARKYTSHESQNEMLLIMAQQALRKILQCMQQSPFLALMVDETTDIANKEQLTVVLRWIDDNFDVFEEFVGMYFLQTTTADSIVAAITDVLMRFQVPFSKIRGQCYDGCSTMAGIRGGVAVKIQKSEPRAVFTHCYGYALNLSVGDTIKQSTLLKDCLDTCYELIKLIKFSPKRDIMLTCIKEEMGSDSPSIRTLYPTRWTVRAQSLASIIANYKELWHLWEEAVQETTDTEMKACIRGISSQMGNFRFFFGLLLSDMVLRHTDMLSKTLQNPELSSVEGHEIAMLTVKTLQSLRSESNFDMFWEKVEMRREEFELEEPHLPRRRKAPRRYEQGTGEAEFHTTAKSMYRQVYLTLLLLVLQHALINQATKSIQILSS